MLAYYLFKGLAVGLAVSAPLGPVGVMCIQRSLSRGVTAGWLTGLGAASADVLCACAAGFGVNVLSGPLAGSRPLLGGVGGVVVLGAGLVLWFRTPPPIASLAAAGRGAVAGYLSALLVTLLNPLTALSLVAIFSGLGMGAATGRTETAAFIGGIAVGAALWWYLLSLGAAALSARVTPERQRIINRVSGLVLVALGAHLVAAAWG